MWYDIYVGRLPWKPPVLFAGDMVHVMEPLDTRFIRKLHELLMAGTVDTYRQRVRPGEYRTTIPKNNDRPMIQGSQIHSGLTMLIEFTRPGRRSSGTRST